MYRAVVNGHPLKNADSKKATAIISGRSPCGGWLVKCYLLLRFPWPVDDHSSSSSARASSVPMDPRVIQLVIPGVHGVRGHGHQVGVACAAAVTGRRRDIRGHWPTTSGSGQRVGLRGRGR